jgi:CS domain
MQTPESESFQREYSSSVFVDEQTLICADGHGTLHVLAMSSVDSSTKHLGIYELPSSFKLSASSPIPFRLHSAWPADGQALAVLSFKCLGGEPPLGPSSPSRKTPSIEFDVVAVRVPLHSAVDTNAVHPLDVLWRRRGTNVPLYIAYEKRRDVFILAGGSPYRQIGRPSMVPNAGPSPDELAPIPRASSDAASNLAASSPPTKPPPPYAWTQDPEEITMALPLPSSTSKTDINVLFSPQTLTVHVQNCTSPRYTAARLWGGIAPGSSFWTWDAHGAHTYGLLTLHLEKQHAGMRWPHVFDLTTSSSGEPEVAETLDPSELYAIRESLEKYTTELREGGGGGAAGLATRSSLTDGEVDDEVDATVGTETCITWIRGTTTTEDDDGEGDEPEWAREDWDVPFTLLSTPLPGIGGGAGGDGPEISMVVKHTIDGLLFVLSSNEKEDQTSGLPLWTHTSTFSALAFVLASKRDTRFTYHVPFKAVLAFEGGGGAGAGGNAEYGGNLYIYREAKPKKSNVAKQAILKLTGSTSGSLLGVGAATTRNDSSGEQTIVLCLCEKELLVLQNVL